MRRIFFYKTSGLNISVKIGIFKVIKLIIYSLTYGNLDSRPSINVGNNIYYSNC